MAESMVVSGLVSKRAEVAGQIASFKTEIIRLQGALTHLDGSIKLFAPEFDLRTVKAKRTNKRNQNFKQGEAQHMTLDVMREANAPLYSRKITDALLQRKNIEPTTAIVARVQKNILAVLHRLEARNIVRPINTGSERGVIQWEIV